MGNLFPIYRIEKRVPGPIPGTKLPGAMHAIKDGEEVILIDPFLVSKSETEFLEKEIGKPTLILITVETHVRDTEAYRKRYGARILANREAVSVLDIAVDDVFDDGDKLPGGLTAIGMPGMLLGETIFLREGEKPALIVGDALFNFQASDLGLFPGILMIPLGWPIGLGIMPRLFMRNQKLADESYQKLLDHDFDQILVSHGRPILKEAKEKLQAVLEKL